mmetsp:Transcript_109136/g.307683  ORF Transcript_109136/g.307683 Transcript_109136/m.307683 type:complete len:544 (+) Transcript_109136:22-1653(+)
MPSIVAWHHVVSCQSVAASSAIFALRAVSAVAREPLWEPSELEHFGRGLDEIPRLRELKPGEWEPLVQAGQPFVVTDCTDDAPLLSWRCADFARQWPDGRMKAEYSEGAKWMRLRDVDWDNLGKGAPSSSRSEEHLSNGTAVSPPFVWHVKDHEAGEGCYSRKSCWPQKRAIQKLWRTPYFLAESLANSGESSDSLEFWFVPPGGGAFAHADAYASEVIVSTQLSGVKTWRLMMYPSASTIFDVVESQDAGIYGSGRWHPGAEFDVGPGECLVFPPGYFHETLVREEKNSDCTVAATFQFLRPFPTRYLRAFLPRLFHSHLQWQEAGADRHWLKYATLGMTTLGAPTLDEAVIRGRAHELMQRADSNGDGAIAAAELEQHLSGFGHLVDASDYMWAKRLKSRGLEKTQRELLTFLVDDMIAYHDTDGDRLLVEQEVLESLRQWCVLSERYQQLTSLELDPPRVIQQAKLIEAQFLRDFGGDPSELQRLADLMNASSTLARFLKAARSEREGGEAGLEEEEEEEENEEEEEEEARARGKQREDL